MDLGRSGLSAASDSKSGQNNLRLNACIGFLRKLRNLFDKRTAFGVRDQYG